MEKTIIYIAINGAAEAYEQDGFDAMRKEIEEWNGSLLKREFNSEEERIAFCDGLEFASECCNQFYVLNDDDVKRHPRIIKQIEE
jgi:hypothetical protein